jgi:AcrR family transcriptional regulator
MKEAGLTVGGFYKHFDSRDDLVAEAVSSAFGGWKRRVDAAKAGGPSVSLAKLIDAIWTKRIEIIQDGLCLQCSGAGNRAQR